MTSIQDIPFEDVKVFLTKNHRTIPKDKNKAYEKVWDLMNDKNIIFEPDSIVEWMIAYNLIQSETNIPNYTIDEIKSLSLNELNKLSKLLTLKSPNINHIINILKYMHASNINDLLTQIFNVKNILRIINAEGELFFLDTIYPNRQSFGDDEILNFKHQISDLNKIKKYNWFQIESIKESIIVDDYNPLVFELNKYKSNDNILIGIKITDSKETWRVDEFIALFTLNDIVIIGVLSGHPRVETTTMTYDNSDGSGPHIIDDINNPVNLSNNLIKYYNAFLKDQYH